MKITGIRAQERVAALVELAQLGGVLLCGTSNIVSNAKATKHVALGMRRWKGSEYVR